MAENLPYFKTYPGDWRKDLGAQSLSYHVKGIWFELRCIMHSSSQRGKLVRPDGSAVSDDAIARLLGLATHDGLKSIKELLGSGVAQRCPESGALICPKMVQEERLRKIRQNSGVTGGNPSLLNQNGYPKQEHEHNQNRECECVPESESLSLEEKIEKVYVEYPRKVGRPAAAIQIRKALARFPFNYLLAQTKEFAKSVVGSEERFIPHPSTWFHQERFNDDPKTWARNGAKPQPDHSKGW